MTSKICVNRRLWIQPVKAFKKTYTYITFAARTALTFISMSRKAIRTFSELS